MVAECDCWLPSVTVGCRDLIDRAILPAEHIVVAQDLMQVHTDCCITRLYTRLHQWSAPAMAAAPLDRLSPACTHLSSSAICTSLRCDLLRLVAWQVASQLETEGTPGPEGLHRLNSTQLQQLDNFYNRAHHAEPALRQLPH